jgi:cyclopropane-fatty-acyl-phospholipid synthase
MSVATRLSKLLGLVLGADPPLRVRGWDGSEAGPVGVPVLDVLSRDAVRYVAQEPNELGLARAYVSGALDLDGDVYAALQALRVVDDGDQLRHRACGSEPGWPRSWA